MATSHHLLAGKVALITGASQGIGKAIAMALAEQGIKLCLGSRRPALLQELFASLVAPEDLLTAPLDLSDQASIQQFIQLAAERFHSIDILIHGGGMYLSGPWEQYEREELDQLWLTNVSGTASLYRLLLPHFTSDFSQVISINSSTALQAKANTGAFAASCHAIKALTDSFRAENNNRRIRVTSFFLGRVATPRMENIYAEEKKPYNPSLLIQPEEIAHTVTHILSLPKTTEITNLHIRPFIKSY